MSGERRQREVFVSSSGPWWGQVTANPQGETGPAASRNQPPAARSEPQSRTSPQSAGKPQSGAGCGSLSVTTAGSGARGGVGLGRKRLVTRGIAVRAPGTPLASLGPPVAPTVHAGPGARWRVPVPRPRPRDDSRAWASERAGWGTGRHGRGAGAARTKPALTPQSPGRPERPGLGASPGSSVTHCDPSSLSASSSHGWLPKAPASGTRHALRREEGRRGACGDTWVTGPGGGHLKVLRAASWKVCALGTREGLGAGRRTGLTGWPPRHRPRVSASIFCSPWKLSGSWSCATPCRMATSGPPPYRSCR